MSTWDLTDAQRDIQQAATELAADVLARNAVDCDKTCRFPAENFKALAELGFLGLPISEAYGGAGADYLSYCLVVEALARVCASTALSYAAHVSLVCLPLETFGSDLQKNRYLPDLTSGHVLGAYGLTEPNAGSDAGGTQTTAELQSDGQYAINGSKIFITNANVAGTFIATAVTEKGLGTKGISAFVFERETPGFSLGQSDEKLGMRGSDWGTLQFDMMRLPVDQRLGEPGQGFKYFMKTLDSGRIAIGALAVGIAQAALDASVKYAKERRQFGRAIAEFQAIQFMLADMATQTQAARLLVYDAARCKMAGLAFTRQAACAKLYASEAARLATNHAVQIHGGYGYTKEFPVERYLRDAKLCEIGEGTSEIQRQVIAKDILQGL